MKRLTVQLTVRDRELFNLLAKARWLSTSQVRRRFFPDVSANAVNKRLRKLTQAGYLYRVRPGLTAECFYRLAQKARGLCPDQSIVLPRSLPVHLMHFTHINDVRLWLEAQVSQGLPLHEFWSECELKSVGQTWPVVPDGLAALALDGRVSLLAFEVDEGTEQPRLVLDKLIRYQAQREVEFRVVVVFASSWARIRVLIKTLYGREWSGLTCLIGDIQRLQSLSVNSPALVDLNTLDEPDGPSLVSLSEMLGVLFASPLDRRGKQPKVPEKTGPP